jgi:antitoxin MazE
MLNDGRAAMQTQPVYKLEDMLKGMTPEAMREAFDWGPDVGREKIDE